MRTVPNIGERVRIREEALIAVGQEGTVRSTFGRLVTVEPDDKGYATLCFEPEELDRL